AHAAGHADPVGPDKFRIVVIIRVGVIAFGIPAFCRLFVEIGIGKEPQADDPRGIAEVGANRQSLATADRLAARADFHAGIFSLILEWVGRAVFAPHIEPKAEALLIGAGWFVEAGLIDCAEPRPAGVAIAWPITVGLARMRG